jgi:hypothetical protein
VCAAGELPLVQRRGKLLLGLQASKEQYAKVFAEAAGDSGKPRVPKNNITLLGKQVPVELFYNGIMQMVARPTGRLTAQVGASWGRDGSAAVRASR